MEYITKGYQPEDALRYFEEIAQIPHGSYNEEAVSQYLWTSPPPMASNATGMSCSTSL